MLLFFHLPVLTRTLLTSLIAILALVGIMLRPFQWNETLIALAGAANHARSVSHLMSGLFR